MNLSNNFVNNSLFEVYWASPPQQSALRCIVAEVERYDLMIKNEEQRDAYRRFVHDFIFEMSLYGYCIYKNTKRGPVVLPGKCAVLRRRGPTRYVPKIEDKTMTALIGSKGWRVLIHSTPECDSRGEYLFPTSAAFKCQRQATELIQLNNQMMLRDTFNSRPSIFTRVSNQIGTSAGSSRPWFQSQHASMNVDILDNPTDLNELIENRAETIRALDKITHTARAVTNKSGVGGPPTETRAAHREHVVSDGRDMTEVRHLQQDTEVIHFTMERLANEIQFAFGVPPQVLGKNINSERLASSNRLTEMAINHFRTHSRTLRAMLAEAFESLGDGVRFGHCASIHTLEQVGHLLKPKQFVELYACSFELKESDFDIKRVKQWQDTVAPEPQQKSEESKTKTSLSRQNVST